MLSFQELSPGIAAFRRRMGTSDDPIEKGQSDDKEEEENAESQEA